MCICLCGRVFAAKVVGEVLRCLHVLDYPVELRENQILLIWERRPQSAMQASSRSDLVASCMIQSSISIGMAKSPYSCMLNPVVFEI